MTGRVNRRQRLRALMFDVQRGECWVCAQRMELRCEPNSPAYATFDEITPRSKGGRAHRANQALAHRACNQRRGNADPTPKQLERLREMRRRSAGAATC